MRIAPSILAADAADFASAVAVCEQGGAELVHIDVMDGHFVPNLTFGIPIVRALRRRTDLPLDVHLMVTEPERLLDDYLTAGATRVAVHWEATAHLERAMARIQHQRAGAGVAINPATPGGLLTDILPRLDFVLVMSVNPGFAGQQFLPLVLDKIRRLREEIGRRGLEVEIVIDGGIDMQNIAEVAAAGVDVAVAGSAVFAAEDPVRAIGELRRRAEERA